ncbi:MAG: LptF/LptG family permease [candidate division WOR-3 bacterium]|nr:LptF/LptG family permease [candidate division WOR-3 bacterium]MCX7757428.1 LptF/LptG family permease [candidate division WOR-3 bacterium]MDW7987784.1 LptF/LptG family permease [candidate division WOR-3 bacterium]
MHIFDRYLAREFLKFLIISLFALVLIYILIDLVGDLDYYLSRHTPILVIVKYYFFYIPSGISLLFSSAVICACFLVYGRLIREQTLLVLESAGVSIYRLLTPVVILGCVFVLGQFIFYEFVTIPSNRILNSIQKYEIEKQTQQIKSRRYNLFMRDLKRTLYYVKEYQADIIGKKVLNANMKDFIIINFAEDGTIKTRLDGALARYTNKQWYGEKVIKRIFLSSAKEKFEYYPEMILPITHNPEFFLEELKNIEELQLWELFKYLRELKKAGFNSAKTELEFHFRFANPVTVFIIVILSLSLIMLVRKGGVMFGLALGLFFAFVYWGLIQICKAYGQILILKPPMAAWLVNIIFIVCDFILFLKVKKSV